VEIARLLVENGANVNIHDKYGATPLHRAASIGNEAVLKFLVQVKGIRLDGRDCEGNTPLHSAIEGRSEW